MKKPYAPAHYLHTFSQDTPRSLARLCLASTSIGTIAALLVYLGDAMQWPHFNRRAGYIGTEFMRDLLYAINDPYAIHIVACLWFLYGFLVTGMLFFACRALFFKRDSKDA